MLRMLLARAVGRSGGMWQAVQVFVQGRQAKAFERERRATLLAVPQTLTPGMRIIDRRADGSVLIIEIPSVLRAHGTGEESGVTWDVLPACGDRPPSISEVPNEAMSISGAPEMIPYSRGLRAEEE
jgi:hypothetical protein